ncbi:MAG TPA: hypothetical protein VNG13_09840 [Mycobacteriales bacterium]|nr:hypothetical protein [Mycobacteriales bacterium]
MGQSRHAGPRTTRFTLAGLLAGAALTSCATPARDLPTRLAHVSATRILDRAGHVSAAFTGELLSPGDAVETGPGGAAILATGGRQVWLGPDAELSVLDGADQLLDHGTVLVDGRAGPTLDVGVGDLHVVTGTGSGVRVERSYAIRIGVLVGSATVTSGSGREVTVPALHQITAPGLTLPAVPPFPLQLTDDAAERTVAPQLVADDLLLGQEAQAIDAGGTGTGVETAAGRLLPVGFVTVVPSQASETVLPLLVAETAATGAGGLAQRYAAALVLRSDNGSWGVIAHLFGTTALRAGAALQALLGTAGVSTVSAAQGPLAVPGSGPAPGAPSVRPSGVRGGPPPPSPSPSSSSGPGPASSPHPSPSPTGSVNQLITTVTGLLPALPTPAPTLPLGLP